MRLEEKYREIKRFENVGTFLTLGGGVGGIVFVVALKPLLWIGFKFDYSTKNRPHVRFLFLHNRLQQNHPFLKHT